MNKDTSQDQLHGVVTRPPPTCPYGESLASIECCPILKSEEKIEGTSITLSPNILIISAGDDMYTLGSMSTPVDVSKNVGSVSDERRLPLRYRLADLHVAEIGEYGWPTG